MMNTYSAVISKKTALHPASQNRNEELYVCYEPSRILLNSHFTFVIKVLLNWT